ncbi:MAG TPA: galactonate dehydratase, partial [Pirellulales bacterium]|nr:galactonate dehydratase [Pirellulales bacterium]
MHKQYALNRRTALGAAATATGWAWLAQTIAEAEERAGGDTLIRPKEAIKVTRLETFKVKPRWLFLKVHTNVGIVGLGEPVVEGRADTVAEAVREIEPYLLGKDPRRVVHHWQAIYRHAFYRGGPVLASALSGIDMALWDIKGKALGVPVYELLGGPTRDRVRVYAHAKSRTALRQGLAKGFTAFKTNPAKRRPSRYVETPAEIHYAAERFAELRELAGDDVDLAIDFHGAISPATAKLLIKALEPYQPMFVEEPCQAQNHDVMAEIARGTHLPIATGERVFTKWGFREVLEKRAATILQPDLCHAGGITEVRLIAGMAEAYYAAIAPHNPLGPISLAAGVQLAAAIPNFLCQEQVTLGDGYLKRPFTLRDGYLDLPTGPGLGITLDDDAVAEKLGHDWHGAE